MCFYFLKKIGVVPKLVDGRRITDKKTLDIVTMTYAGLLNKKIVTNLQKYNCNSLGLSGSDGNLILAKKRGVKKIENYSWYIYSYVFNVVYFKCCSISFIINCYVSRERIKRRIKEFVIYARTYGTAMHVGEQLNTSWYG